MRFHEHGPVLPAELLARRDAGDVLFFCGAGVSMPTLPGFDDLTERVFDALRVDDREAIRSLGFFDRRFSRLTDVYGRSAVEQALFDVLSPPGDAPVRQHRILLDLARDPASRARLVTTNFDPLFERAQRRLKTHVAPFLPDLSLGSFEGLVYLHGRLRVPVPGTSANYVISSRDFGRAYLAEGWATRFMRDLRGRFTLVFVGYTADDSPMRYLMEGLHAGGATALPKPYAFTHDAATIGSWEEKGVTPILYDPADGHRALWDTLDAWARTARDPAKWRRTMVSLAQRQPATLKPFQRGQVARLVATADGAAAFAGATPPPPAEWLCVLDAGVRRGAAFRASLRKDEEVDPLDLFGLDDEPPRVKGRQPDPDDPSGEDWLGWRAGDALSRRQRLTPWHEQFQAGLTSRLHVLARWIATVMHHPCAAWWAAGAGRPHPALAGLVRDELDRRREMPAAARRFWRCWLEAAEHGWHGELDGRWYELERRIVADGWTTGTLREFARALQPRFAFRRGLFGLAPPPQGTWPDERLARFLDVEMKMEAPGAEIDIPDRVLPSVVAMARDALLQAAAMEEEGTPSYAHAPSLHREHAPRLLLEREGAFLWFADQFRRLVEVAPEAARREWEGWPGHEPRFFGKLVIFGAMVPALADGSAAAARLLALPDGIFWDAHNARELLFTLRARWPDFPTQDRARIERRIRRGRPRPPRQPAAEHRKRRAAVSASMLRWMQREGLALTRASTAALPKLQAADPHWNEAWAENAAMSYDPRGGIVATNDDTKGLHKLPPAAVLGMAEQLGGRHLGELREDKPFQGLVVRHPLRALAALRNRLRAGEAPRAYWEALLYQWPDIWRPRLDWLLAATLARLPAEALWELRFSPPLWLQKKLPKLAELDLPAALRVFDAVLDAFAGATPEQLGSGIGDVSIGGQTQPRSAVSLDKAINAPGGNLAEALVQLLGEMEEGRPLPSWFAERVERLLTLPGDGAGHAAATLTMRAGWLLHWLPDWAEARVLPLFDEGHPLAEAAWHGLLGGGGGLRLLHWRRIKPAFARILAGAAGWRLDPNERRTAMFCLASLCLDGEDGPALFARDEARGILRLVDDEDRAQLLTALRMRLREDDGHWPSIARFLDGGWPMELQFRFADRIARAFADLATSAGDHLPDAVRLLRPLLRPIRQPGILLHMWAREDDGTSLARLHPADVLALADALVGDSREGLYGLKDLLDKIAAANPGLQAEAPWRRLAALTG